MNKENGQNGAGKTGRRHFHRLYKLSKTKI